MEEFNNIEEKTQVKSKSKKEKESVVKIENTEEKEVIFVEENKTNDEKKEEVIVKNKGVKGVLKNINPLFYLRNKKLNKFMK